MFLLGLLAAFLLILYTITRGIYDVIKHNRIDTRRRTHTPLDTGRKTLLQKIREGLRHLPRRHLPTARRHQKRRHQMVETIPKKIKGKKK